jgi:hypothetical protein
MGQYFRPCIIDDDRNVIQSLYSHEYGFGLKLWEHGMLDELFTSLFESLLALDGARRVVWAGDYAPEEPEELEWTDEEGETHRGKLNLFSRARNESVVHFEVEREGNVYYSGFEGPTVPVPVKITSESHPYLLNHDKRLYVDKRTIAESRWRGERRHPLVVLTLEASGPEYYFEEGESMEELALVGSWARDRISVGTSAPEDWEELKILLR